jgi:hypothetical protein
MILEKRWTCLLATGNKVVLPQQAALMMPSSIFGGSDYTSIIPGMRMTR